LRLTVVAVLDEAERHLDEFDPETSGAWPHAAAALIRQSLESTLDFFWRAKQPEMVEASARDRWVCLPYFLGLTQEELREHLAVAREFVTTVASPPTPRAAR